MKIEFTEIHGFAAALRGMRNPRDSWDRSDSWLHSHVELDGCALDDHYKQPHGGMHDTVSDTDPRIAEVMLSVDDCNVGPPGIILREMPLIGPKDLELACSLIKQGGDHRKFLRYIIVTCDFVIPRYVWQEVDTYKIGTVRNSCSTMNTLGKRHLVQEDFENGLPDFFLAELNRAVDEFQESGGGKAKRGARVILKDLLPEGFLQRATYLLNYEVGYRMFFPRRKHRLPMWREGCEGSICEWIKSWPYMNHFLEAGRQ